MADLLFSSFLHVHLVRKMDAPGNHRESVELPHQAPLHLCPAHEDERLHPAKPLKLHVVWGPLCVCLVKMEVPRRIKEKIMPVLQGGCVYEMVRVKTTQNTIPI